MATGAADALSSLGGDLTFSVSWSVATELLDGAREAQLGEAELIAIVLGFSVVLSALPAGLNIARTEAARFWAILSARFGKRFGKAGAASPAVNGELKPIRDVSGIIAFLGLFVNIFQRISVSIVVQLLAANVRTQQPLRVVRVLTLLTVAVFFLFLEATATVGRVRAR